MSDIRTTEIRTDDAGAAERGARCLADGGLVAFPTETVYGLGADATNADAIARLYLAKGRPAFNPLIAHVADRVAAAGIAEFDADADRLAAKFWPGPLTLVLPKATTCDVADLATAGLDTIAVRIPAHPFAARLVAALGKPVVAPSANRSGHVSPTSAAHVRSDLAGRIDMIIDGGSTEVGLESTIVACLGRPRLLRPGGIPRAAIEAALDATLDDAAADAAKPLAPGMLASHYAPRTKVRLNATALEAGEALLAFGAKVVPGAERAVAVLNLSERGDLSEAATRLFGHLRALDALMATEIAVMPIPHDGLGEAINDRLRRAAA